MIPFFRVKRNLMTWFIQLQIREYTIMFQVPYIIFKIPEIPYGEKSHDPVSLRITRSRRGWTRWTNASTG
jgi:hypothetical protein